nr:4-hydroxy-3-methylbut-2-enyl diphosphate reductase [Acidimicrobiia bacterium]
TMAVAPERVHLVETPADVAALDLPRDQPVAFLAQTTLSLDEWSGVLHSAKDRWPDLWQPGRSDLCYATTNRQSALKEIAHKADAVVVLGSENSSNTKALASVAVGMGCPRVLRVNGAHELPDDLAGVVGVTAGASAPEELVEGVIARLAPARGVTLVDVLSEDEYFPPPPELRKVLDAVGAILSASLAAPFPGNSILVDDRNVQAVDVLDTLVAR